MACRAYRLGICSNEVGSWQSLVLRRSPGFRRSLVAHGGALAACQSIALGQAHAILLSRLVNVGWDHRLGTTVTPGCIDGCRPTVAEPIGWV